MSINLRVLCEYFWRTLVVLREDFGSTSGGLWEYFRSIRFISYWHSSMAITLFKFHQNNSSWKLLLDTVIRTSFRERLGHFVRPTVCDILRFLRSLNKIANLQQSKIYHQDSLFYPGYLMVLHRIQTTGFKS